MTRAGPFGLNCPQVVGCTPLNCPQPLLRPKPAQEIEIKKLWNLSGTQTAPIIVGVLGTTLNGFNNAEQISGYVDHNTAQLNDFSEPPVRDVLT